MKCYVHISIIRIKKTSDWIMLFIAYENMSTVLEKYFNITGFVFPHSDIFRGSFPQSFILFFSKIGKVLYLFEISKYKYLNKIAFHDLGEHLRVSNIRERAYCFESLNLKNIPEMFLYFPGRFASIYLLLRYSPQ